MIVISLRLITISWSVPISLEEFLQGRRERVRLNPGAIISNWLAVIGKGKSNNHWK